MSEELVAFYEENYPLLNKGSWLILLYQVRNPHPNPIWDVGL